MIKDSLGDRMKTYENVNRNYLMNRCPIIIRVDGCHFHTFTKKLKKPFDMVLTFAMQETARYLCQNIAGTVLAYTQSDEISLVVQNYETLETNTWFDGNIQKIASVSASLATLAFNKAFKEFAEDCITQNANNPEKEYFAALSKCMETGATFDARCFNLPKEEVTNYIYWREKDAMRNSVNAVGFANFSSKELKNKKTSEIKQMLLDEKSIIFGGYPIYLQRGSCIVKKKMNGDKHGKWLVDPNIPIFKDNGRNYIESLITFDEY